ncbi:helix-turn-helix domain-containing protein [Belliella aquatica]|uniref:HTH cro/C1-type domain-containing protein n=1 Tax=Belliella aquatica TaxID=1323734 RepID=A0ABQ1N4Q5_9BACT|nr:helix-turn-helix transcriptional regulator [Belliella aquatica]MCH7407397.1 helix-turn-helix transcriptional regulator [Belliella aquatica]GGC53226.1 hypothetical protein GCM10010993_34620 [Belliella aquatica]
MAALGEFHEGLRLGAFRKAKNISQQEMAKLLGCSQPNLSKIEKGVIDISTTIRNKVFEHFPDLNPNWLLRGTGDMIVEMISFDLTKIKDESFDSFSIERVINNFKNLTSLIQSGEIPTPAILSIIDSMGSALKIQDDYISELKAEVKDLKSDKQRLFILLDSVKKS